MRIKVDFSDFFDDERKLSVVNVNTQESVTVKDVLHKIIRLFKLAPTPVKRRRGGNASNEKLEFGLFEEGFYVPPEETSTVLQDVGILKLKTLSNTNEEIIEGKKKKHKIQKTEEEEEEEELSENDENTVKKRRRSKRNKIQKTEEEGEEELSEKDDENTGKKRRRSKINEIEKTEEDGEEELLEKDDENAGKKRRRSKRNEIQKIEEEGEEELSEKDDENTVKKRRRSKRNKDEEEEIIKESRKSKKSKDEVEETIKESRKSKRNKDETEEIVKEGRKSERNKEEAEEIIKEARKNKRKKDETEEIIKEGRKSKKNKDEAEEILKEGRKSKRHEVDVEENNKVRKGRRRKESVETDAEEEEDTEDVDSCKKGKRQSGKKSRVSAESSDAEGSNEEQSKKTKRREKVQTDSDSEVEEPKSKRKSIKDSVQTTTSLTSTEEVKDTPLKNKKSKKDRVKQEEECLSETETKQTESESVVVPETKQKCTRQSLHEVNEASAVHDLQNLDQCEEKRSQEKEISTSNVIHVESDEACESSSGSDGSSEEINTNQDLVKDSIPVSSIADEPHVLDIPKAKKRRRKHKKKARQNGDKETGFPIENYTSKTNHSVIASKDNFEKEHNPMKVQHKNSDVSTSSMRSHIHFNSDDEEEVTSASNSGDGNDIEFIGTSCRTSSTHYSGIGTHMGDRGLKNSQSFNQRYSSGIPVQHSTPLRFHRSNPSVIEIEADDMNNKNVGSSTLSGYATDSFHSRFAQNSHLNEGLATFRKMCENKTITIVNVNTRSNTVHSQPVRIPSPVSPIRRGPPLPAFQSPSELSEDARNTFYNLLALQHRTVPLVVTSREAFVESVEDIDDSDVSSEPENTEISFETEDGEDIPVHPSLAHSLQKVFQEKADAFEVLSVPSTSGYTESCNAPVDKPGPSTKFGRKCAPRSFQAIGAVLSNLKLKDSCKDTEELQMVKDIDVEIEAIPSSPEEITEEKDSEDILSSPEEITEEKDTEDIPSSPEEITEEKDSEDIPSSPEEITKEKDTEDIPSSLEEKEQKTDTEAIPSLPEEIKQEKNKDVTNTQGQATTDEIVFAEALNIQDEKKEEMDKGIEVLNIQNEKEEEKSKGNSPSEPALFISETDPLSCNTPCDAEENQQLIKEVKTENLKEDLLKELKKEVDSGDEDNDSRFLKYPLMKTLPKRGEYLAVKILSLDEKLRPVHSNYIQVQVQDVSGLDVKLKTISNLKNVKSVTDEDGVEEVDLTFEDEVDLIDDRPGEILELDWRDVLEPRHLYP